MKFSTLISILLLCVPAEVFQNTIAAESSNKSANERPTTLLRHQEVYPLPGELDNVLLVNDNNPELITEEGILLSTFPSKNNSGLNQPLNDRFDLFSHHVYAGKPDKLQSTLWIALVAQPIGNTPVELELIGGSTSLSQATASGQTAAPFIPLPSLIAEQVSSVASGPGSKVAGDLLRGETAEELPKQWLLKTGSPTALIVLPLPVAGLDPLLNGRTLQLRMKSSGPIFLATLASFGDLNSPPSIKRWIELLNSEVISSKEHNPTPRGSSGKIIYSRVSGIQIGSTWNATITDPGSKVLVAPNVITSWPISSLERGTFGTNQIETAELKSYYQGTAWAAHGNYGVEYDISIPIINTSKTKTVFDLSLDSPIKTDKKSSGLRFRTTNTGPVVFRGPIEVSGLDGSGHHPQGKRRFHLVLRQGQRGTSLGKISLAPGEQRRVNIRLIYPADATPPQVLTLAPVKQSISQSSDNP